MTTATQIPEQITTQVNVKGKEELEEDFKVTIEIPLFKSKYPTTVYVKPLDAAQLRVGVSYNAILHRSKLQQGKDGGAFWMWQWRWGGIAKDGAPAASPAANNAPKPKDSPIFEDDVLVDPNAKPKPVTSFDSRELSIQRQVSLKCANDVQIAMTNKGVPMTDTAVLKLATAYNQWLLTLEMPEENAPQQ